MTYSDFRNADDLRDRLGIIITAQYGSLAAIPPIAPSSWLEETLLRGRLKAARSGTEKARSEWLITPVLTELEDTHTNVAIFSGRPLRAGELAGTPDFVVATASGGKTIEQPIFAVVEAKRDDFEYGIAQCIAAMAAAHELNSIDKPIGGAVTNGTTWQFLDLLHTTQAQVDEQVYTLEDVPAILGILHWFCVR
jgi:hypothetical protein